MCSESLDMYGFSRASCEVYMHTAFIALLLQHKLISYYNTRRNNQPHRKICNDHKFVYQVPTDVSSNYTV